MILHSLPVTHLLFPYCCLTTLKISVVHTHCFQLLPSCSMLSTFQTGLAQNLLLSPGIQLVNTMPLCKLENGTRLHGYMINSCGLHMHGSEAGRASGPLTHLNRHHCARHASPSTVLLLWLPLVKPADQFSALMLPALPAT